MNLKEVEFSNLQKNHIVQLVKNAVDKSKFPLQNLCVDTKDLYVGNLLGIGGFGQVHELRSPGNSKQLPFVIKSLKENLPHKDIVRATADLLIESALLNSMRHPNIISLKNMSLHPFSPTATYSPLFLLLDRLSETLETRINKWNDCYAPTKRFLCWRNNNKKVSNRYNEKIRIIKSISCALEFLHKNRVIHRDLKPDNIGFSSTNDQVKLFDFGVARLLPDPQSMRKITPECGTYRYMAPEVMRGSHYDVSADTYSWSIVAVETLTQNKPYDNYVNLLPGQALKKHRQAICYENKRPEINGLPANLSKLIKSAWHSQPSLRPSMSIVQNEINV